MSKAKSPKAAQKARPWWRYRKNGVQVLGTLAVVLVVAVIGAVLWLGTQGMDGNGGGGGSQAVGQQVQPFELPDVVSGRNFSLADYLGKRDIVVVSYMGWF